MVGFVRSIAENTEQIPTIEIHVGDIAEQLKRIADALEKLSSVVKYDKQLGQATAQVEALCYDTSKY